MKKIIYCGGNFEFQYKDYSVDKIANDYRVGILGGDVNKLIHTPDNEEKLRKIGRDSYYCGPYYFYEEGTDGNTLFVIVDAEPEVCQKRILERGDSIEEEYHNMDDLKKYRDRFLRLVGMVDRLQNVMVIDTTNREIP